MSHIIVRVGVLKRVQKDRLIRLAVMYVKPASSRKAPWATRCFPVDLPR